MLKAVGTSLSGCEVRALIRANPDKEIKGPISPGMWAFVRWRPNSPDRYSLNAPGRLFVAALLLNRDNPMLDVKAWDRVDGV